MEYMMLKEVCRIKMGQAPASDSYNDNGEGIPFFQGNADFGERYPVARKWCLNPIKIAEPEDILISVRAPIGALNYAREECCIGRGLAALTPDRSKVSPEFMFWLLKGKNAELNRQGTGSTFKAISRKVLEEILVPGISLDQQKKYSEILRKLCRIVQCRKQELQKLDELIKARFVEMFGDPITNEMGWEKVQLSTCIESIDNGKSLVCDASARQGNWPAVLKLSAATYGFYRPEENKAMLNENQFVEDAAVRAGDLLFTRKNTPKLVGMCAYVYDTPSRLMMPDLIFRLNTTNRCNKMFLWKLINHDLFRDCIQAIATGSAKSMSNISKERLLSLEIILPPAELQEQFAAFVAQTDKSKSAIQKSLEKTQTLFDSLMQKYFG